jgi:hypothetical protein
VFGEHSPNAFKRPPRFTDEDAASGVIDGRVEKIPDEEKADMHSDLLSSVT